MNKIMKYTLLTSLIWMGVMDAQSLVVKTSAKSSRFIGREAMSTRRQVHGGIRSRSMRYYGDYYGGEYACDEYSCYEVPVITHVLPKSWWEITYMISQLPIYLMFLLHFRYSSAKSGGKFSRYEADVCREVFSKYDLEQKENWRGLTSPRCWWRMKIDNAYHRLHKALSKQRTWLLGFTAGENLYHEMKSKVLNLKQTRKHHEIKIVDRLEKLVLYQDSRHMLVAVQSYMIDDTSLRGAPFSREDLSPQLLWDYLVFHKKYRFSRWRLYAVKPIKKSIADKLNKKYRLKK